MATLIELGHRVTSGLALLLVAGLVDRRLARLPARAAGAPQRRGGSVFMVLEALIGAGLVLLELVAGNASIARAWWIAGHLVNTFLLVAALTLTAWWATHDARPRLRAAGPLALTLGAGARGHARARGERRHHRPGRHAVPRDDARGGRGDDVLGAAHAFVRLRVWHPVLALVVGALVVGAARRSCRAHAARHHGRAARARARRRLRAEPGRRRAERLVARAAPAPARAPAAGRPGLDRARGARRQRAGGAPVASRHSSLRDRYSASTSRLCSSSWQ